jgi:hypothetical protein
MCSRRPRTTRSCMVPTQRWWHVYSQVFPRVENPEATKQKHARAPYVDKVCNVAIRVDWPTALSRPAVGWLTMALTARLTLYVSGSVSIPYVFVYQPQAARNHLTEHSIDDKLLTLIISARCCSCKLR